MQFTPFDTHFTPVIAVEQDEFVVRIKSVQVFSLQELNVLSQKQTPSVPYTQPVYTEYDVQVLKEIHAVPVVVHKLLAENAEHPA